MDGFYVRNFGVTRSELDEEFLCDVPRGASVCEIGAGAGPHLERLAAHGYSQLCGLDVSDAAMAMGNGNWSKVAGEAIRLPFASETFDLVFTSGTLIHVPPPEREQALTEIARLSRRWIWGYETVGNARTDGYFVPGVVGPVWPDDWVALYARVCPGLELVRRREINYLLPGRHTQVMFMFEKEIA